MITNLIYDMNYLMYRNKAIGEKNINAEYFDNDEMIDLYNKYLEHIPLSTSQTLSLKLYLTKILCKIALYRTITEITSFNSTFKGDRIICCFDSPSPWRKQITSAYKHDRVAKRASELFDYKLFYTALNDLYTFINEHTKFIAIKGDSLEADDIIYLICKFKFPFERKIIISADKDLMQILQFPNTKLYNPLQKKFRELQTDLKIGHIKFDTLEAWKFAAIITGGKNNTAKVFKGKRIGPAKSKKLYSPQTNFMELKQLFEKNPESAAIFSDNILLIDFEKIPEIYIHKFNEVMEYALSYVPTCTYEPVLQFLQKYQLNNLLDKLEQFLKEISNGR